MGIETYMAHTRSRCSSYAMSWMQLSTELSEIPMKLEVHTGCKVACHLTASLSFGDWELEMVPE